ncbi:MAG: cytochrome c oxidase assembly protein, partial [Thermoanaerobaculia bacterium]
MTVLGEGPVELLLTMIPAVWYARGVQLVWRRAGVGRGVSKRQVVSFAAGIATLLVVLSSPVDEISDALFSAHMVQHLALILVAAPLCVGGAPLLPMLMAFSRDERRSFGKWWKRHDTLRHSI